MAENLGAIRYEVEVETASMLKAEAVVNKSISNQVKEFDKADKAVREFTASQKELGRTVNSMGQVLNSNGKIVANATLQYRKLANEASMGFEQLNTSVNGVTRGVRSALPDMSNLSYQFQDIAVQAQMGIDPLIIATQQLPQILVGMGSAAAIIGAVIAVLGVTGTAFLDTTTNAEKLQKAIENVQAVMTVGADGIANYTDEMKRLSNLSETLAKLKLATTIAEQNKAIKLSISGITDALGDTRGSFDTYAEQVEKIIGVQVGSNGYPAAEKAFRNYSAAIKSFASSGDVEQLEQSLVNLSDAGAANTETGQALINQTVELIEQYRLGKITTEALKDAINGVEQATSNSAETASNYALQLLTQKVALEQGERAAFIFKMQLDGLDEAEKKHNLTLYDSIKATEASNDASKQASDALEDEIDNWIKLGEEVTKAEERKAAAAQREKDRLAQRGATVGLTQVQTIEMRYENDLKALQAYFGEDYALKEEYVNREIELQRQKTEAINRINADGLGFLGDAFANFEQQSAAALTSVVTGAQTGSEALKGLARTILTYVIQAFIQKGIAEATAALTGASATTAAEATKTAAVTSGIAAQSTAAIAATAATTTAAAASGATIAAAMAPAAAATSVATAGAAPAAAAPIALSTIGAIMAALTVGALAGGRQYGGPVSQGMYRVNETGVPEIYSHGGKDYLMNTKNANIKPLEQGGASGMTVNINNNTPYEVFVTQDQAANIANIQIGREASKAAKGQGTLLKGVMAGTNTTKRARN